MIIKKHKKTDNLKPWLMYSISIAYCSRILPLKKIFNGKMVKVFYHAEYRNSSMFAQEEMFPQSNM